MAIQTPVMGEGYFNSMNDIARLSKLKGQAFVDWVTGQKDLDYKLMDWLSVKGMADPTLSAGQIANDEAMAKGLTGQAFADYYQKRYQELYDRDLSAMLQARGLLP